MRLRTPEWLWTTSRKAYVKGFVRSAKVIKVANYLAHRCLLPCEAIVGENLILEHYALGIVIHPNVTIGDNCRIYHHVTIAGESVIGGEHRVTIGDDVAIGVNAVILPRPNTSLSIGRLAYIGAGCVVTRDIPERAIVAGVPGRVLRFRELDATVPMPPIHDSP